MKTTGVFPPALAFSICCFSCSVIAISAILATGRLAAVGEADATAPSWRRHWRALVAGAVALILALGIGAAISWHFASAVLVPDHSDWPQDITVEGVRAGSVVLSADEESERPGTYGIEWQGGPRGDRPDRRRR